MTKFTAIYNGKKISIEGKSLWDAKQKAIKELKVPKSKEGLVSVMSDKSIANQDFRFMARGGEIEEELYVAEHNGSWTIKDKKNPHGNYTLSSKKERAEKNRQYLIDNPSRLAYYRKNEYAGGGSMARGGGIEKTQVDIIAEENGFLVVDVYTSKPISEYFSTRAKAIKYANDQEYEVLNSYAEGGEIEDRIRKDYSKTNVISDYNIEFEVIHEELNDNGIQIYIDKGDDDKGESILEEINEDYFNGKGTINDWEDRLYLEVDRGTSMAKGGSMKSGGVIKGKRMIKLYADAYNNGNRYETNRWWENDEETKEVVSEALSKRNEDLKNGTFSFMNNLPKKIEYAKGGSMARGGEIKIVGSSYEDIGLGKINTKFNDGTEIIWSSDDPKVYHPRSRYLNDKDIKVYVDILRKNNEKDSTYATGGTIIKKGNRVRVVNTQYDGKEGLVVSNDLHNGNYQVQIDGKVKGLPFENLMLLSRETYASGGLTPKQKAWIKEGFRNSNSATKEQYEKELERLKKDLWDAKQPKAKILIAKRIKDIKGLLKTKYGFNDGWGINLKWW